MHRTNALISRLVLSGCCFIPGLSLATEASYGLMGITAWENAKLAAFCLVEQTRTPEPCEINLHFHDIRGRIVKQASLSLQPDTGGFLDIRAAEVDSAASRVTIVPCIFVGRGRVVSTIQVYDLLSLRTRILMSWGAVQVATAGEMHAGPAGITAYDVARVSASCGAHDNPTAPCEVTLLFHDLRGRIVRQRTMTLQPGTGGFLDVGAPDLGGSRRVEIIPCIRVSRGAVVGSIEIIDNLTGMTTALAYPGSPVGAGGAQ